MKQINLFSLLILFCVMYFVAPAQLQADDSWSWNPFAKSSSSRDSSPLYSKSVSSSKSTWWPSWKAPKMPWSKSGPTVSSYNRSKTTTWGKINRTTKTWWRNTAEFLDPYPEPKPPRYEEPSSASKKTNWFPWTFQKEEPQKIETMQDWLKQEQPKY